MGRPPCLWAAGHIPILEGNGRESNMAENGVQGANKSRIQEKDLLLPALYIIRRDGTSTMPQLIQELTALFRPVGEDAAILNNRNDMKFSQKVRNLKSHRAANGMAVYTNLTPEGVYTLTEEGERYLSAHMEQMRYLFSHRFPYGEVVDAVDSIRKAEKKKQEIYIYSEHDTVSEGRPSKREAVVRERSRKLRNAAIEYYRDARGRLACAACGFCFEERYGQLGRDFIEIHHESPMYQYSDDDFEQFVGEAVKRLKPLCSNCHSMIHRDPKRPLTIEELKEQIII